MIKLDKLDPFKLYRLTSNLILPVNPDKKRGLLVSILAPSIQSELDWLRNKDGINPYVNDMRLYKYFIEKITLRKYFKTPLTKVINDSDSSITNMVTSEKLNNIDGVTSYKAEAKTNVLKGYNTLYEINHIINNIIDNPKDSRTAKLVAEDICLAVKEQLNGKFEQLFLLGDPKKTQYKHLLFIPVNIWTDVTSEVSQLFTANSKNLFGQICTWIGKNCKNDLSAFCGPQWDIVLINVNEIMILSSKVPQDSKGENFYLTQIKTFLRKCKSSVSYQAEEQEDKTDEEKLQKIRKDAELDSMVDDTMEKLNISSDNADAAIEARKNIKKAVQASIRTQEEAKKKEDMYKVKDHEEKLFPSDNLEAEKERFQKELDSIVSDSKKAKSMELVINARLAGQTVENYKRNMLLREKHSELKFGEDTIQELAEKEAAMALKPIELETSTINPKLKKIQSHNFEKMYNETCQMYDFANILTHFANAKPAIYLIKDPIIEDISDEVNRLYRVTVEYEDENRKRSKFSFKMPKFYQDKYLFLNQQKWNIIHQKVPFPITKTDPNLAQISTNYSKIRMHRAGNNVSAKITKLKKTLKGSKVNGLLVTLGNGTVLNKNPNIITTIEYDEMGSEFYKIEVQKPSGKIRVYFSTDDAALVCGNNKPKDIPETCFPFAIETNRSNKNGGDVCYYLDGLTNKVYKNNIDLNMELSDFLVDVVSNNDEAFKKAFEEISAGTKFMYTSAHIMHENIPIVLVLGCVDPGGLQGVIEKAKINHYFTETRPTKIDKTNQGIVRFSDGYLVFDRYPYENSLLLNGLDAYPMRELSWYDMSSRDTYIQIFDSLYNRRTIIDGLENFYYLMIDPITKEILERLHLPTDFTKVALYANGLLADNSFQTEADYNQSRLRSNEIVNVYLYQELCAAYADYKYGRNKKFSIIEDAVIKKLISESQIVDSHSKLNITKELEDDRQVKLKGPGGLNEEHSFTIEKRAYHPTMQGVIGINSVPSGEVGINRHMSLNSNIVDARGFITINKDEYDGTEIMTPGELLNTFACESSDVERVAMSISQAKHLVPVAVNNPSLVNYDMERIAPHLSNDFAFSAKQNGKVVAIDQDFMIVQYEDGSYDDIDLSCHPDKNTDGGFHIINQFVSELKVGSKFKKNEILASDHKYISGKDDFGDNMANVGTLARVAIVVNGNVFEDATYVSQPFARKMAAKITREKIITISKFSNIKYFVKVGQKLEANDPILIFDDTQDEFTSQMLASMAEETDDSDIVNASTAPVITKVPGVVKDIQVISSVPTEDLTPSLRKLVETISEKVRKRKQFLSKYVNPKDANTILPPSDIMPADQYGRVSNIKVGDGVIIKVYIEYEDILGVADKLTNFGALKGTVSFIIPEGKEAYTLSNPDRKVDLYLSCLSIYRRMSLDVFKVGAISKFIIEKKRILKEKYYEKIKAAIK